MSHIVEKCLQAWTNSLRQMNTKANIVFFGDSLTYYGDFSSVFPDKVVCNLVLKVDNLAGLARRVEQVKLVNPSVLYLMGGLNDVASLSLSEFEEQYERLLGLLIGNLPVSFIIVQGLFSVNNVNFKVSCDNEQINRCNDVISSLCLKCGLEFVDLHIHYVQDNLLPKDMTLDGFHLRPLRL